LGVNLPQFNLKAGDPHEYVRVKIFFTMTGVILCGGQSTRMHKDKGLLMAGRITWAEKMALLLQPICDNLVISINPKQHDYQSILGHYTLVKDDASLNIYGPLHGLLSVHQQFPGEDIFLLACDMQQMQAEVLDALAEKYRANPDYEAWVFLEPDGSPEPLAAIYSAKSLASMLAKHLQTPLPRHSMKYLLEHLKVFSLTISGEWATCFANFNYSR
jgi:molybdopterin-guanine dinucleotide biosynthesis protein A